MNMPFSADNCRIAIEKQGSPRYTRMSFPVHCGIFTEMATDSFVFHFNLNAEIIRARMKGSTWAHPHEWLKRTRGDDWVYYSTGGYTGVFEATGEYYLPNFAYPTNNLLGGHPFTHKEIAGLTQSWHDRLVRAGERMPQASAAEKSFLTAALANTPSLLADRARELADIIGGRISVLPPDARHVDYNLVPLTIAEGCLYKCRFCKVKNSAPFREKTRDEIRLQLARLKSLYARDLVNYNALFLGEHDALQASPELILFAMDEAFREFDFADSVIDGHRIFLFGSVTSLLNAPERLFQELDRRPGFTFINIGLESADGETLARLGKPVSVREIGDAFTRIQKINESYSNIEMTANFVMADDLPGNHYPAILHLIRDRLTHHRPKGTVYFSPLAFSQPSRARLFDFNRLKVASRLPTFLYIIQRL